MAQVGTRRKKAGKMPWREELDKKDLEEFPLFMTKVPDDPEANEALAAMAALKYEGMGPVEIAGVLKNEGNELYKMGPKHFDEAKQRYAEALAQNCGDDKLIAVIRTNRAAVNLRLKNYGSVVDDCQRAQALDPSNVKAAFRGATACLALERVEEGLAFCDTGLLVAVDSDAAELRAIRTKLEPLGEKKTAAAAAKRRTTEAVEERNRAMHALIQSRGIVLGKPIFAIMDHYKDKANVCFDEETQQLVWPVIFMYPEYQQTDFIQAVGESDTLGMHLEAMFGSGCPPAPWDEEGKYRQADLVVYAVTNVVLPLKAYAALHKGRTTAQFLHEVEHDTPLCEALAYPGYVVPHFPAFQVLVRGSPYHAEFVRQYVQ